MGALFFVSARLYPRREEEEEYANSMCPYLESQSPWNDRKRVSTSPGEIHEESDSKGGAGKKSAFGV
jgi:hypothetical protein